MTFWLTALIPAVFLAAVLIVTLLRGRAGAVPAAAYDLQVYRDQLQEVERDLARGILTPPDAERARIEVSRKVLEADRALRQADDTGRRAPRGASLAAGALSAIVLIGGAGYLYTRIGAPGYPDLPLALRLEAAEEARLNRPRQAEAEAQLPPRPEPQAPDPAYAELITRLRAVVAARPDDPQGLQLLARNEARLGNYAAGYAAQARLIELKGDAATAGDLTDLAEMMILAAGGYVSPEAEAALQRALTLDRTDPIARYYFGLLHAQTGRPDVAFDVWLGLWRDSVAGDPWVAQLRETLPLLARRAGQEFVLPPLAGAVPRGPGAADIEAASGMGDAERAAMIRGMVEGLAERLAEQGGSPAEWAQLIGALGTLGETGRAAAIWAEAQQTFAGDPLALERLRTAAEAAGVAQ